MSIKTETTTINGREFTRTYSDSNFYIECDGVKYAEAIDPVGTSREYTETAEAIPDIGKFTPTEDTTGGDGSESNPYEFVAGTECVPNAFYRSPKKFVFMPADAEKHSYDSWADAAASMVEWSE